MTPEIKRLEGAHQYAPQTLAHSLSASAICNVSSSGTTPIVSLRPSVYLLEALDLVRGECNWCQIHMAWL
jgi:hypothetical protein